MRTLFVVIEKVISSIVLVLVFAVAVAVVLIWFVQAVLCHVEELGNFENQP